MKKVFPLMLLALLMCQCSFQTTQNTSDNKSPRDLYPERFTDSYISEKAMKLIDFVPDHGFDPSIKVAFTDKYYSLLEEAWAVPVYDIGVIGDDEWLYYFMTGNGDCDCSSHPKTILELMVMDDHNAWVKMNYIHRDHNLVLHFEDGDWKIDNFDGTLDELENYIRDERKQLRIIDWPTYIKAQVDDLKGYMTEKEATDALNEFKSRVDAYFEKYPDR